MIASSTQKLIALDSEFNCAFSDMKPQFKESLSDITHTNIVLAITAIDNQFKN